MVGTRGASTGSAHQASPARLDDAFDAKCLLPVGHGLCSVVNKAPLSLASRLVEEHGGAPGWVCMKHVDVDEQNAPHDVQRELALLRRLRHEHLVTLLAAFTQTPDEFTTVYSLAMPLYAVPLPTLLDAPAFVPSAAPFASAGAHDAPWRAVVQGQTYAAFVLDTMRALLSAVAYLHAEHVAHRDIKPANVLFGHDGRVKLIDLGVAWAPDFPETTPYAPDVGAARACISEVGTGAFRAPELLFAPTRGYDAYAADVWSLSVLFASFLTAHENVGGDAPGEDEAWGVPQSSYAPWEQALWPRPPPGGARRTRTTTQRRTLFDASRGDIGLAGDVFDVLGRPDDVAAWPEAAHFQPPLAQFPFVPHASTRSVLDRLPALGTLDALGTPDAAALAAYVRTWLPRGVQLSAQARPEVRTMLEALPREL